MAALIKIDALQPHPNNPRLSPRQDIIEQISAQIVGGFDEAHALLVRPVDGHYEIISGHHRFEAAKQAGLTEVPCWVRDLSDDEAYMQLVLCNTQSELHPLEEGIHALNSGLSGSEYARKIGKPQPSIAFKIQAARVLESISREIDEQIQKDWRNLAEIHAAPKWMWGALVSKMIEECWTVNETREKVGKVSDLPKDLPDWINAGALAANIVGSAVKVRDVQTIITSLASPNLDGDFLAGFQAELNATKISSLSGAQALVSRWMTLQEQQVARLREAEVALQREREAAAQKVERMRVNCSLEEWNDLSDAEKQELLNPDPHAATFNKQESADIEWAQWSWNPVTGCKHECSYCYARDIATGKKMASAYPNGFEPSFRSRSLNAPMRQKVPAAAATDTRYKNVFTCSMADLFGRWVPEEWINAVLDQVRANPQWNFLFLTKFPRRMTEFDIPNNAWMGTSVDLQVRVKAAESAFEHVNSGVRWLSVEPLLEPLKFENLDRFDWVVIGGASSSSQTPAWFPPVEWIFDLVKQCRDAGCKVYLKSNLFGSTDQHRAVNARILELPFDAPVASDPTNELPDALRYLGK